MRKTALVVSLVGWSLATPALAWMGNDASDDAGNSARQLAPQPNPELLDILSRLEQMQAEVQQLRGMVEEQSQTIADLQRKQKNMYMDLDSRIQSAATASQPAASQPTTAEQPAANAAVSAVAPAVVNPNPVAVPVGVPVAQGGDKERYQQAYEALRSGQNAMAVKLFEALLTDFPNGQYSDNAQYWLAEAYKVNREIEKSRNAFIKVITQYPSSAKVPDALLKLGYIEFELQNIPKCREYLLRVTNNYPGTPAANLAAKKLAQMP